MKYEYASVTGKYKVEVNEKFYDILQEMDRKENNSDRKYNRHNPIYLGSADYLEEWMDESSDILGSLIQTEDREELYKALAQLTLVQQNLVDRVYFYKEKIVDIAQELGVSQPAISQRLTIARKKLKAILQRALYS